jgi:hypothetical protein
MLVLKEEQMTKEQKEKLVRYLINSNPFLWGVLKATNKKERLKEIKELGFLTAYSEGSNPTYGKVNQDLLVELGIEAILENIVVKKVNDRIAPEHLSAFRRCWESGRTPDKEYLKRNKLYRVQRIVFKEEKEPKDSASIFLQIDRQHDFVERWTVFAGLWFEEIEPNINKTTNE